MHWENKMKKITAKNCIELIKQTFPKFLPYWESYIRDFGPDLGLTIQMIPFEEYALSVVKINNVIEIKKIFDFVELLFCNGDESVKDAIATSFLEYLLSKDPDEIKFKKFVKYMGENAIGYCRAWDKFTGTRTEGLWEDS